MLTITLTLGELSIALRYAAADSNIPAIAERLQAMAVDVESLAEMAEAADSE